MINNLFKGTLILYEDLEIQASMLLLIVSFIIFLFISLQINQYFSYKKWFDWFLGEFLILISLIILVMTVSGLFYQMNQPLFVLVFQIILLFITTVVSRFWLKPEQPLFPFPLPRLNLKEKRITTPVWAFLITTVTVAILNLVYVLFVPPNNNDSLAIHLARIGMWDQSGSWLPWNTKVVWQLTFPMNAEIVSYWTLLFTRGEHLLGLIAYISGYLSIILIYHLGLEITSRKSLALLSALTWAAFPVVQMNFSSTRHDHVSSFMLIAAVYFFYHHLKEKNNGYLVLSGLGIGLSIGTNYSVAGYLPGLALFFLIYWLVFHKITFK
ncbi:MAG: glycosyltransferase family 39 protein, partial [Anaerolineaceae bacterium]|nr:glycosyltransferase family 39 protein [Anaerolineaceae bacterium]